MFLKSWIQQDTISSFYFVFQIKQLVSTIYYASLILSSQDPSHIFISVQYQISIDI